MTCGIGPTLPETDLVTMPDRQMILTIKYEVVILLGQAVICDGGNSKDPGRQPPANTVESEPPGSFPQMVKNILL